MVTFWERLFYIQKQPNPPISRTDCTEQALWKQSSFFSFAKNVTRTKTELRYLTEQYDKQNAHWCKRQTEKFLSSIVKVLDDKNYV